MPNSNATQCNTSLHMPSQRTMKNDKNKIPYRDMRTYQIHISGCIRNPHKPFLFQEKTTKSNKTLAPKMPLNNICIRQIFHTPPDRPSFQCAKMPYQLPLYISMPMICRYDHIFPRKFQPCCMNVGVQAYPACAFSKVVFDMTPEWGK